MGRSSIHAVRPDGKTLCGRFDGKAVIHIVDSMRPIDDLLAVHGVNRVTCRNCIRVQKSKMKDTEFKSNG